MVILHIKVKLCPLYLGEYDIHRYPSLTSFVSGGDSHDNLLETFFANDIQRHCRERAQVVQLAGQEWLTSNHRQGATDTIFRSLSASSSK